MDDVVCDYSVYCTYYVSFNRESICNKLQYRYRYLFLLGVLFGGVVGTIFVRFFRRFHIRDSVKVLIILSVSFLLLELQNRLEGIVPVSGLLAIMSVGIIINQKYDVLAKRLSIKYNKLWLGAEIFLFVLVGIAVDLKYALAAGIVVILLVILALVFRMMGVVISLVKTKLNKKEQFYSVQLPIHQRATVQAALGTVPLVMGLPCGEIVLTVAGNIYFNNSTF